MPTEQCAITGKMIEAISFFRFSDIGKDCKEIQLPDHVGILYHSNGKLSTLALPGNARAIVEMYQEKFRQTAKFANTGELLASMNVQEKKENLECSGAFGETARTALLEGRFINIPMT